VENAENPQHKVFGYYSGTARNIPMKFGTFIHRWRPQTPAKFGGN
jgi:hypothetical protein